MLINVNHPIVQKLNDLVADDQKETAKKYLDILYTTALFESRSAVKNMHDYSMWIQSMLEREIKQVETACNDAVDEHIGDPSKDEVLHHLSQTLLSVKWTGFPFRSDVRYITLHIFLWNADIQYQSCGTLTYEDHAHVLTIYSSALGKRLAETSMFLIGLERLLCVFVY